MIDFLFTNPLLFLVWAAALLLAITVHEFSHAYMADRLGDPTPRLQGRLTLNPLAHLDPIGTLMLLLFRFGWGKPVQFDPFNLQNPKRDAALISLAGPGSNLILAAGLSLFYRVSSSPFSPIHFINEFIPPFIFLNVVLAIFNLLPIHPLDGGKILVGLLPTEDAQKVDMFLQRYGLLILLFLILPVWGGTSPVFMLILPIMNFLFSLLVPGYPIT
jgi:Zn-dependent protease